MDEREQEKEEKEEEKARTSGFLILGIALKTKGNNPKQTKDHVVLGNPLHGSGA